MNTATFTLGGEAYTVKPLQISQLMVVMPLFLEQPEENVKARFESRLNIIQTALSEDYPDMTMEKLLTVRATMKELLDATREIGVLSGVFEPTPEAPQPGEAG